jgi:hypothetical protein
MSGGTFDYNQYRITDIADEIETRLLRQGQVRDEEWARSWEPPDTYMTFSPEVELRLIEAVVALRIAAIYAQRADWLFSGDDGEESFLARLNEELEELVKKYDEP